MCERITLLTSSYEIKIFLNVYKKKTLLVGWGTYQAGVKQQLPALHRDLVGVGLRGTEGEDLLVGEDLQGPRFTALVHGHGFGADAQPQLLGEGAVPRLRSGGGAESL